MNARRSTCSVWLPLLLWFGVLTLGCSGPTEPVALEKFVAAEADPQADAEAPTKTAAENNAATLEAPSATSTAPLVLETRDTASPTQWATPEPASSSVTHASSANERALDITFDKIKFDIEPGDVFERGQLTPEIENLLGKKVRIRGYILPSFKQSGITQFVLVRDNLECCFGPGAALYDCIRVEMNPGKSAEFSVRPVTVEGVLQVEEFFGPDDKHWAIYHMTGDSVK